MISPDQPGASSAAAAAPDDTTRQPTRARRRAGGPELVVIYWRDIPLQVNARHGEDRHQRVLPARFQRAVDRAAMTAGITTADEYVLQMRRSTTPCSADLNTAIEDAVRSIRADYRRDRLVALEANGGWQPRSRESSSRESDVDA
jgi:hypothetical protein